MKAELNISFEELSIQYFIHFYYKNVFRLFFKQILVKEILKNLIKWKEIDETF